MPISQEAFDAIFANDDIDSGGTVEPKRGDAIFEGTDYPRDWDGFIGQAKAKEQLQVALNSALARDKRIDHTLIASGLHGVGKSTLATLLAYQAGAGLVQASGQLTAADAEDLMRGMQDGDILFIDEAHMLTQGSRTRADWLLPFMTEGVLYTERGAKKMPDITIVAATTDVGKLPETLISRFMVQPPIVPYTRDEAAAIVLNLADRMGVNLPAEAAAPIAQASGHNPRTVRRILTSVRDLSYTYDTSHPNLDKAFEYSDVSPDGLSGVARDMLVALAMSPDGTASLDSIKAQLGEPGPIRYHEQVLLQRNLVNITGRGRKLTDLGRTRARAEVLARR